MAGHTGVPARLWPATFLKGLIINADATSEYLGVGYIIGPRVAGVMFAGGVFSWLVVMPLIYFFGKDSAEPCLPRPCRSRRWARRPVVRVHQPMGAGAVAAAGLITLVKTLPTIWGALAAGLKTMRPGTEVRASQSAPKTICP